MNDREPKGMHPLPAKEREKALRQVQVKVAGGATGKVRINAHEARAMIEAHEENKAMRLEIARLQAKIKRLESGQNVPNKKCPGCGHRLVADKVCGNPVCELYQG